MLSPNRVGSDVRHITAAGLCVSTTVKGDRLADTAGSLVGTPLKH